MSSIFSKIIRQEIPCHKLFEDDDFIAFLDLHPIRAGHALVVPKIEIDYIFDQSHDVLSKMLPFARKVATAIEKVVPCTRMGLSVLGLEVPHTHMHLVPISEDKMIDFRQAHAVSQLELAELAEKIRQHLT